MRLLDNVRPLARGASPEEFRWLGEYNRWWVAISGDLLLVSQEADAIASGYHRGMDPASPLWQALDRLARCKNDLVRTILDAPTKRLRRLHDLVGDACFAVEQVADSGLQMVLYGESGSSLEAWPGEWRRASRLLYRATRQVAAYDPALAPSLPSAGGVTRASRIEPLFGRVATRLAGKRVSVRCWSEADWAPLIRRERLYSGQRITVRHLGFARLGGDFVNLAPFVCDGLVVLVYLHERPAAGKRQLGLALVVDALSHEPLHSRGVADEAATECFALQRLERTATLLGVERPYARKLARVAWRRGYALSPADYRSPECRDGGAYDLRPKSSKWPS